MVLTLIFELAFLSKIKNTQIALDTFGKELQMINGNF